MSANCYTANNLRKIVLDLEAGVSIKGLIEKYDLEVKKIHGKDEYEMYKNYINDVTETKVKTCLDEFLTEAEAKDDTIAHDIHDDGHTLLYQTPNKIYDCHYMYTESLSYAVFNSKQFAKVLVSRAVMNYKMRKYKNCLKDIEMVLNADCPKNLKIEMIFYRTCCFEILGKMKEAKNALVMLSKALEDVPESTAEEYKRASAHLLLKSGDGCRAKASNTNLPDVEVPTIDKNPSYLNASSAVSFEFDEETGYRVIANRDITTGDVLFVEKAYAHAPYTHLAKNYSTQKDLNYMPLFCRYCIKFTDNAIPCKSCVYNQYCDENCRDMAWNEFHRWECVGVSPEIFSFNTHGYLALRIIFRAVSTGLSISNLQLKDKPRKYGNKDNNYPYVCNLPTNLDKMSKKWLTIHCATAAFYVQFLKERTDFFSQVKKLPGYRKKSRSELYDRIGGLIIRHCAQLHCYATLVKTIYKPDANQGKIDKPSKILTTSVTMCPSIALMRHSCAPNTAYHFVKDVAVVRSTVDIKENEEIFRAYTNLLFSNTSIKLDFGDVEERKEILKKFCFINCKCQICTDPIKKDRLMYAYLCIKCKGAAARIGNRGRVQCVNCNYKFSLSSDTLDKEDLVDYTFSKFQNEGRTNVEELYKCLQISEKIYYPYNNIFVDIYDELAKYCVANSNAKEYLMCSRIQMKLLKEKCLGMMEYAIVVYGVCVIVINIMKRKFPESEQELTEVINGLNAALFETEVILQFYCPSFILHINKFREEINKMKTSYTASRRELLH